MLKSLLSPYIKVFGVHFRLTGLVINTKKYHVFAPMGRFQSWLGQETEVTSTPTRPVDNVVIATKGLQDRNINITAGTTAENKGKLSRPN